MDVSDETLVHGCLSGDHGAFAALYDRWAPLVRAVCWDATQDLDQAEDLAQEVFLRAYQRLDRLRDGRAFPGWIVGVARQVGREWRRRRRRETRRLARFASEGTERNTDASPPSGKDDELGRLRDAIAQLPEKERTALHAFYLLDMSAERARAVLGLSRSGLYRVLSNARSRLRRALQRQEIYR